MSIKKLTIKAKLILFCTVLIILVSSAFLYTNGNSNTLLAAFIDNQETYHAVNGLTMALRESRSLVYEYLNGGDSESLDKLRIQRKAIRKQRSILTRKAVTNNEKHLARALVNSTDVFFKTCERIVYIRETGTGNPYVLLTEEGDKLLNYIYQYTSQYLQETLNRDSSLYDQLKSSSSKQKRISFVIILAILLLSIVVTLIFSNLIANPIKELVEISRGMAQGDLQVKKIKVKYYNEVGDLTDAFNQMSESIANLIRDLEEKSEVEGRLFREKLKNSRMEELLKESQFHALQSQVNPHFLFNTLNTISRAIRFESQEVAVQLVQSLAQLFRYNLDQNDKYCDLGTELEIVKKYLFIQEFRFRDRLSVKIDSDPACHSVLVPKLTIQPLVENAFIHGLENLNTRGYIHLQIRKRGVYTQIRIFDNGVGISREKLDEILHPAKQNHTGHTTSVGIQNVTKRLEIFCHGKFTLTSLPGRWTIAGIKIPNHV
ncbi:MAG: sensor histidine kinase [Spirochaetales bacterium]|nr:sensor histidine kinase [Spirochaetales bacterium]